jgi:hypothetical protein
MKYGIQPFSMLGGMFAFQYDKNKKFSLPDIFWRKTIVLLKRHR